MIAIVRSIHGDHKQALKDIENLFPLVSVIAKRYPPLYYSFLNSLAIELGEVGRIQEAKAVCEIAFKSPFAAVYPEFAQTRDELEAKRTCATPSVVAVSVASLPKAQPEPQAKPVSPVACCWPARKKDFLQRAITAITVTAAIARIEITPGILERVRHCIQPRAPSSFQI